MSIKKHIIAASREHFKAHIRKHATNIHVILANPIAIPQHTDVMDSVERELDIISGYESKLQALEKYLQSADDDHEDGSDHETEDKEDKTTTTTTTESTTTTQQDATVVAGAGSHINIERPFTV